MENFFNQAGTIKKDGALYGSLKDARIPPIASQDIAECAAAVLRSPAAHAGNRYSLTGGEALTQAEIAAKLTKALGKPVKYVDVPVETAVAAMKSQGVPGWMADDLGKMTAYFATGAAAAVLPDTEKLLGRKPTTFDAFLAQNASAFA
jgi:uncharacterized protein YbjT (DUF2867 family)